MIKTGKKPTNRTSENKFGSLWLTSSGWVVSDYPVNMRVMYHCFRYEHRRPSNKSRQAGVRGKVSLVFGKVSPGLSYPYPDPQQGTLRTRVRVQNRLIGQFGAPQARQNVPAPSMRHCGLGVYSTQCCTHYCSLAGRGACGATRGRSEDTSNPSLAGTFIALCTSKKG